MASSPLSSKKLSTGSPQATHFDDDDASTAVPSDVMGATASDISAWDAGNLEDLSSCGVLSSAELRAARLQKLNRASPAQPKARSTAGMAKSKAVARPAAKPVSAVPPVQAKAGAPPATRTVPLVPAAPKPQVALSPGGYVAYVQNNVDLDDRSTAAPSDLEDLESLGELSSVELRALRLQIAKSEAKKQAGTGSNVKGQLDKSSREAIREMGLWEHMPARNPVVTRTSKKGADWNVGFEEYQHTLGGVPDAKPIERPHEADQLMRHLDAQSQAEIKEMGLWQHMPAKNPVVTKQSKKGAAWHVGFSECENSLGGVPDSGTVERPHAAEELKMRLDVKSRGAIKDMGLWEHMPARNPVVTGQTAKGAEWHVGFNQYVHTLGGTPDSQAVERPHHADEMNRQFEKSSREAVRSMGKQNWCMGGLTNKM